MSEKSINKSITFEKSITRLDEIVKRLEQGDVPLDDALKLFEEGTGLVKSCNSLLEKAELQVVKLVKGVDGAPEESLFAGMDE